MKNIFIIVFVPFIAFSAIAQDALVELESTDKGFLLPRVELVSAMKSDPLSNHVPGMLVYNQEKMGAGDTAVSPGIYYNNGKYWLKLIPNPHEIGDLKFSYAPEDHDGWYVLDGRLISGLPTVARANASHLGFKGLIPNASNRFLKGYPGEGLFGKHGGDSTVVLVQANLPDAQFSGQALSNGAHQHRIPDATWVDYDATSGTSSAEDLELQEGYNHPTDYAGDHTHWVEVNSGGSDQPILIDPPHILVNVFIYLGK